MLFISFAFCIVVETMVGVAVATNNVDKAKPAGFKSTNTGYTFFFFFFLCVSYHV
ncbi:hypothetical protein BCR42DRAFT_416536 [Absidia repens]|uniref:Uncharacterized protein n=1 Tax=Absidia repens TaxID=90262 RepID=A0A1X2IEM9_9FUNG|nr:hypothetical protein BCR42DRAFT_416536 [Absidia repens]